MQRAASASGVAHALVKSFEARGGKPDLVAYSRPGDPITIGFGHTGKIRDPETGEVRHMRQADVGTLTITAEYANELYKEDSKEGERRVDEYFGGIPLTQGQRDALFSFCYNLTLKSILSSTLRKMILAQDFTREGLVEWWVKYRNPKTIFEQGLYRRRIAELCLWFGYPYAGAWGAELRRDSRDEISFISNPELILYRAEAAAESEAEALSKVDIPEIKPLPEIADKAEKEEEPSMPEIDEPEEAEPVIEPQPPAKPAPLPPPRPKINRPAPKIPYGNVDPLSDPKAMIASKRFWGLFILILSRFTFLGLAGETVLGNIVGDPLLFDAAAASLALAALFFFDVGGQWLSWYGRQRATRTLQ